MRKRIGRNDPCSCGSGRKYKKCCQARVDETDFQYRHWRQVEAGLIPELLSYALESLGPESIEDAWGEFHDSAPDEEYDPESPMNTVFIPWFLFNWIHEAMPPGSNHFSETTIAESFLSDFSISADEEKLLVSAIRRPYSLCEVIEVTPGATSVSSQCMRRSESSTLAKTDFSRHSAPRGNPPALESARLFARHQPEMRSTLPCKQNRPYFSEGTRFACGTTVEKNLESLMAPPFGSHMFISNSSISNP